MEMHESVWVGQVGNIILARLQGPATAALVKECHERIVNVVKKTGCMNVLYHLLDLESPLRSIIACFVCMLYSLVESAIHSRCLRSSHSRF
jgi:hypothetical protein